MLFLYLQELVYFSKKNLVKYMKPNHQLVSIVIPTYNSSSFIERCLSSVLKTTYPNYEVILVDDCSTDSTREILSRFAKKNKRIKLIFNQKNILAAASRNSGFNYSSGEFIALLDHDSEVDSHWITEMVKKMQTDNTIGIVQGKVYDINKRNTLQNVGLKIYPQTGWVYSPAWGVKDRKQFDAIQNIVAGATGVLYRKSAFKKIGGFDEYLGINVDDLDINWRMWIAGYSTVLAPHAITYHWSKKQHTRDSWIKRRSWEFHYAKILRIFLKNYSFPIVIYYTSSFLLISVFRGVFNIITRFNFSPIFGLLQSIIWNIQLLPNTLSERKSIQQQLRKKSDTELFNTIFLQDSIFFIFHKFWMPVIESGKKLSTEKIKSI